MAMGQKENIRGDHRFWSIFPLTKPGFLGLFFYRRGAHGDVIFHSKHIKITVFYSVLCLSECQTLGKTLFFNEILKGNDLCKCMWMNICNTFFKNQQKQFSRGLAENQKKTIFQRSCRKPKKNNFPEVLEFGVSQERVLK